MCFEMITHKMPMQVSHKYLMKLKTRKKNHNIFVEQVNSTDQQIQKCNNNKKTINGKRAKRKKEKIAKKKIKTKLTIEWNYKL